MRRKGRHLISIVISLIMLFISTSRVYGVEGIDDYIKEYKSSIYRISKMIRCIPKTGDMNLDYLYEMAFLSEGEIEFSKAYIEHSNSYKVKQVAGECIKREALYIDNIKSIIENLEDNKEKDQELEEKYLKTFESNLDNMIDSFQKVEISEDIDMNFLKFITIHHEGVIGVTEDFLDLSKNNDVREIANKIIRDMRSDLDIVKELD